jgi:hypothetical protein
MKKTFSLTLILSILVVFSSCDKQTKMKNLLEGKTWNATVTSQFNSDSEVYTGTFVFDKTEFYYTSTLTDSDGNTVTTENNQYSVGPEAVTMTLSDTTASVIYNVDINERKSQEWSYSESIDGNSIYSKIELTR